MIKNYNNHSLFLYENKAIQDFAASFYNTDRVQRSEQWSVVCERKEDLITVRNQLFHEIEKLNGKAKNTNAVVGISMHTLDSLARNFCSSFASTTNPKVIKKLPTFVSAPYIDILQQESLVETILHFLNYHGNDSLPIAKQILSLIDIPWSNDFSIFDALMQSQEKNIIKSVQEINEISLKQILACFQISKTELQNYNRLQTLIRQYLQADFKDHILDKNICPLLILPKKFLQGHILWIGAPEYLSSFHESEFREHSQTIKPGNFQSAVVNEFKESILFMRCSLNYNQTQFFDSRTVILETHMKENLKIENTYFHIADNLHDYQLECVELLKQKENLTLLADFDLSEFKISRKDAGGNYKITEKDIIAWKNKEKNYFDANFIFPQISKIYKNHLETISLIQDLNSIHSIAKVYGLAINPLSEMTIDKLFIKKTLQESYTSEGKSVLSELPKALSFFCSHSKPSKINCIGRAHAPTASSFHVKILNNVISIMRKHGVLIDLPASELMYRGFWKSILNTQLNVHFYLKNSAELENFPAYIQVQKNITSQTILLPKIKNSSIAQAMGENLIIPDWKTRFYKKKSKISITELEKYIHCPLQFFLSQVLKLKTETEELFPIDHMHVGSTLHAMAEVFLTHIVTNIGSAEYCKIMLPIYEVVILGLKDERIFTQNNKNVWLECINKNLNSFHIPNINAVKIAFEEAINSLWDETNQIKNSFQTTLEREVTKRTFLRFLQNEKEICERNDNLKVAIFRECSIQLTIAGCQLSGKIDRIDASPTGIHIVDYKTSKVPNKNFKFVLLPSQVNFNDNSSQIFSVQGALYSVAWVNKLVPEEQEYYHCIQSFSLYRLKNLDEEKDIVLSYKFSPPLIKDSLFYNQLILEYSEYIKNMNNGNFNPKPISKNTCNFCDFKNICPKIIFDSKNIDGEESDE